MKIASIFKKLLCCLLVLSLLASPVCATEAESDMSVMQGCRTLDGQRAMHSADERLAKTYSALLYDVTNDVLLYADNPDGKYSPAGLVKIMTGLIMAEQGNMQDEVTVKQELLDDMFSGNRGMDLQAGEILTMQDLMYSVMIIGSNIAATVAADHIAGSEEAFVQMMNDRAAELGCTDTNFVNVHGLSDDLQVTTARDVAKIIAAAMKNDVFMEGFGSYVVRLPATNMSEERKISSENFLFNRNLGSNHFDGRATGSRMGLVGDGAINLVVTAESNDIELISIVLGSTSEINPNGEEGCYKEARILLDKGFLEHEHRSVLHENQVVEQFKVENGANDVTAYVSVDAKTSLPVGTTDADLTYRFIQNGNAIKAPVNKDNKIASVEIWFQNVCIADAEMFASNDVAVQEAAPIEEIAVEHDVGSVTVLTIVIVIIGLLIVLLFGRRIILRVIRKRRVRRHRKQQRRSR